MTQTKLEISVAQLPQLLPANWAGQETLAVVIDTLRFTTTAAVALAAGAESVSVAAEVEAARELATQLGPNSLLCGERHCHRIEGFHFGNSPLEYTPEVVSCHPLVFSTTNGTRAVAAAQGASEILLGSLINRQAVAEWIVASDYRQFWIVCAGTDGQIAAEDVFTAGAIIVACQQLHSHCTASNDSAHIATGFFRQFEVRSASDQQAALVELLSRAAGGKNLIDSGYQRDIAEVAKLDSLHVLPRTSGDNKSRFWVAR